MTPPTSPEQALWNSYLASLTTTTPQNLATVLLAISAAARAEIAAQEKKVSLPYFGRPAPTNWARR